MSGFAGVFHLDGAPVDRAWLEAMAGFLAFRGPDATQIRAAGNAGLCHTLLHTSATGNRPQIASLDDSTWIAGDVRIDDRETLIAKLPAAASELKAASSSELILHAYRLWGTACVEHLLGDFSFVIWDAREQRVFAARDHLGVRPFYYARIGQCLIVSNTLDCIRQIPIVSDELNEQAIGDYLIADMNFVPATTFYRAIQRLPVARRLIAGRDRFSIERYWTLPIDELHYRRSSDYAERFRELLLAAVRDRLPDDAPLGVFMSGGLDSPALAAAAVQLGATPTAITCVYDRLIPDQERYYAGLVAQHLAIPIHYFVKDDEPWGWEPDAPLVHTPEPCDPLALAASAEFRRDVCSQARVFFHGFGPDAALSNEWRPHLSYLARQRRWLRLGQDLLLHLAIHRHIPLLQSSLRARRERKDNQADWYTPGLPAWLNPEFEARLKLKDRFQEIIQSAPSPHPCRKTAYNDFAGDLSAGLVDGLDAGITGMLADTRHPFLDIRLLRFLLSVPAVPWCRDKYLMRTSLRGWLPEIVRKRPKSPLSGFPYLDRARSRQQPHLPAFPALGCYVDIQKIPMWPGRNRWEFDSGLRVLGLQYWLLALQCIKSESHQEEKNHATRTQHNRG